MRTTLTRWMTAAALASAATIPAAAGATVARTTPRPLTLAPVVVNAPAPRAEREQHPAIRAAIRSLEKAKYDLQHAAHDFGGHRVDAIKAVDVALAQLRLALQYDTK